MTTMVVAEIEDCIATTWLAIVGMTVGVIGLLGGEDMIAAVFPDEADFVFANIWDLDLLRASTRRFPAFDASQTCPYR